MAMNDETLSLNASAPSAVPRGVLLRVVAAVTALLVFTSINLPTFVFFASKAPASAERYAIAVAQTLGKKKGKKKKKKKNFNLFIA